MKKECKCKDWKKNVEIISLALTMNATHGFNTKGLKKKFKYCPWCGKELVDELEKGNQKK